MTDFRETFSAAGGKPQQDTRRDARLDARGLGARVCRGDDAAAFAAANAAEAGSCLPLLMALAQETAAPNGTAARLRARFPWLDFWYNHDFIHPLFEGRAAGDDRWLENTRMTPRGRDDAFIVKAAIVSDSAAAVVPYLLGLGRVELNTANDRPVTLAALLGKTGLLPTLVQSGADPFAARAEAFRLARQAAADGVEAALLDAAKGAQRACRKKLMQRSPRGLSTAALRAGDDETGLHLAVRAGMMRLLLEEGVLADMTAADFLKPSVTGATAAHTLAATGEFATLFDERLWHRRPEEAGKIYQALDADERVRAESAYGVLRDMWDERRRIDAWQSGDNPPGLRLPPRPRRPRGPGEGGPS